MFLSLSLMIPILYLIHDRYTQKALILSLQEESLKSELNLLKSQINPHFFFNTLNNLYGLAVEKSDKTEHVIYKLSEMMRFTIYDGRKESVTVNDEINYLKNFIELHTIRYKQHVQISFETNIESMEQRIPPLLFINLLENAFKHGVESLTENAYIKLNLSTSKTSILFEIENNYEPKTSTKKHSGIGIENLKRRLELLFPKKHTFTKDTSEHCFKTKIEISLV